MSADRLSLIAMIIIPAACMILIGIMIQLADWSKRYNCNHRIKGQVDSYEFHNGMTVPVVSFSYQGSRFYARVKDKYSSKADFPVGMEVEVHFNPRQPSQNYAGQKVPTIAGWICIVSGVCFAVIFGIALFAAV